MKLKIPIPIELTNCRCIYGCDHERHHLYRNKFTKATYEGQYYWNIVEYIKDKNISPLDADDLELFQDIIFESPMGRIHIYFYERLFDNSYKAQPEWTLEIFCKYLEFLDKISPLFTHDAFSFVFRQKNVALIESLLKVMPIEIKLRFIREADNYPQIIKSVPKLKLYNLFS